MIGCILELIHNIIVPKFELPQSIIDELQLVLRHRVPTTRRIILTQRQPIIERARQIHRVRRLTLRILLLRHFDVDIINNYLLRVCFELLVLILLHQWPVCFR